MKWNQAQLIAISLTGTLAAIFIGYLADFSRHVEKLILAVS